MTSPAFVEANYEVLESLLWERRRQISNEDLQTGLEYFNEDYDEERKMKPRSEPNREATPTLRLRSHMVRRQRERVVGFEEAPNREGSKRGRNAKGSRPSEIETRENGNMGVNLPPLLAAHLGRNKSCQPLQSSLTFVYGGHQPLTNIGGIFILTPVQKPKRYPCHKKGRHETNDCHQLRNQIEETMKSGQLFHLVKGIKKERVKTSENQRVEGKKDKGTAPAEAPILMIRQDESYMKNNALKGFTSEDREITFPSRGSNSSAPVCSFMLCDLDIEPLSSSMPSCDLVSLTNILILCLILKASNQSLRKSLSLNLELS
ncbi:hypothetical protein Tco_0255202 [Tanacetum coccineum]